jgi:hypothetical protein
MNATWKKPSLAKVVDLINKHLKQIHTQMRVCTELELIEPSRQYSRWGSSSKKEGGNVTLSCYDIMEARHGPSKRTDVVNLRVCLEATNTGIGLFVTHDFNGYGLESFRFNVTQVTDELAEVLVRRYYMYATVIEEIQQIFDNIDNQIPFPK